MSVQTHKNIVAVAICNGKNQILIGKHIDGPYKGMWGIPSIDSSVDRRPQRVAEILTETSLLGMLGTRNSIKATRLPTTPLGLQLYKVETTIQELPEILENTCKFIQTCFSIGTNTMPSGLISWTHCKWISYNEILKPMDPFASDAKQQLQVLN